MKFFEAKENEFKGKIMEILMQKFNNDRDVFEFGSIGLLKTTFLLYNDFKNVRDWMLEHWVYL